MTIALAQKTPVLNQSVLGSIPWEVYCTVDSSFDRIDFSIDSGPVLWVEKYSPFMFNGDPNGKLDTTKLPNGSHVLTTRAYDKTGVLRSTLKTTVIVANPTAWLGKVGVTIPGTTQIDTAPESTNYFTHLTPVGFGVVKIQYTGNSLVEDQAVQDALTAGLKVRIGIRIGALSDSAYASRCTDAAVRYGAMGITEFELGTDINVPAGYVAPSSYFTKAKLGYNAIKAVNLNAKVAMGALKTYGTYTGTVLSNSMNPTKYLEQVYIAAAGVRFCDEVVYNSIVFGNDVTAEWVMSQITGWGQLEAASPSLRSMMTKYGYSAQKTTIGAFGVPTDSGSYTAGMSEAEQARLFPIALDAFKTKGWAGDFFIYTLLDPGTSSTSPEDHFGIYLPDYTAKAAVAPLTTYLAGTPAPAPAPPPGAVAPTPVTAPAISGTAQDGHTVTAVAGTYSGDSIVTYDYTWEIDGAVVGTGTSHYCATSEVGHTLKVHEKATTAAGLSAEQDSAGVTVIAADPVPPPPAPSPSIPIYAISLGSKIESRTSEGQDFELSKCVEVAAKMIRIDHYSTAADTVYTKATAKGLKVWFCVKGVVSAPGPGTAAITSYCSALAQKYLGKGIAAYEIFNEPDIHGFTPDTYFPYLKAAYQAIKAADSSAKVFHGGLWKCEHYAGGAPAWMQRLYQLGAKNYMDGVCVHCYDDPAEHGSWSMWDMTFGSGGAGYYDSLNIRSVMNSNGDSAKPIHSTESGGPYPKYTLTKQATIVGNAMNQTDGVGTDNRKLASVHIYTILNDDVVGYGLLDSSYVQRPAWHTYHDKAVTV